MSWTPRPASSLRHLLPLFALILVLLISAFSVLLWWIQEQRLREIVAADIDETATVFDAVLDDQTDWLNALATSVAMDTTTREALAARDPERLDRRWRAMFERLRARNGLTHFYFIGADRRALLRLHAPERAGDRIDRFTARQAERDDSDAQGIELGPLGTFTLRAISPIHDQGRRIGYVEVGKEIEDILASLYAPTETRLAVIIRKHLLERGQWEQGMRLFGRESDWDRLSNSVITYSSPGGIPAGLDPAIEQIDRPGRRHYTPDRELMIDHTRWRLSLLPLDDAAGRHVGDLLLAHDLTSEASAFSQHIRTWGLVTILLLTAALSASGLLVRSARRLIRRQQTELIEHQGLLAATLRSLGEGVISTDADNRIIDINQTGEQLTGWAAIEARGRPLGDVLLLVDPETRDPLPLPSTATVERATEQALLITRGDDSRPVVTSNAPIRNDQGHTLGAVIVFRDMSEAQRIRHELELSRERYMLAIDCSSDGVWDWDLRNNRVFISPRWKEQIGFADDELDNAFESFETRLHPDDRHRVLNQIANYLQQPQDSYALEFRLRHKDGSYRWILSRGRAMCNAQGDPYRMSGSHTDISARKEAERTMTMLSAAVEHSDDLVAIRDLELRVIAANPAFAQAVGANSTGDLVGRTDAELLDIDPGEEPARSLMADERRAQFLPAGENLAREHDVRLANGETRTLLTKKYPIYDHDQRLIGTGTLSIDISARKRAEDALRETNAALKASIERANALANRAKMASRAKSRFLSNMSHEIRTPLNGVIGMLGLLHESPLSADQQRYLEIAQHSGEGLLKIINDILDFSKVEAGKLELERIDFDLGELLDDFVATMALHAHEKTLELTCTAAPDIPTALRGDPGRVLQILTNLVGNAIKFTEHGEVAVRATLLDCDAHQVRLRLAVRDTGIGIPRDKRERLFHGFSQVDPSNTRRYGGTGLGLAITKQLVELMGGELGLESTLGQGSIFWCDLPFARQRGPEAEQHRPQPSARLRGARVLVVDDNRHNRELIAAQLSDWGLTVAEAGDGDQALEHLHEGVAQEHPFTIALIDVNMPDMDGLTLGEAIRAEPTLAGTALVMMTALGIAREAERCARHALGLQLTKPMRQRELLATLEQTLTRPADQPHPVASPTQRARHPARLLLADDNLTNQQVALGILGHLGFDADCVSNGRQVLEALEARHYDLLLLDVQMPLLDGLETTRHIRDPAQGLLNRDIPIIAMTAHALEEDRERCLHAGMNDYLAKPIDRKALAAALEQWLPQQALSSPGALPVLDTPALMEGLMADSALIHQVIETFLDDLPKQLAMLNQHQQRRDLVACARHAYHIEGAAASLGARQLAEAATELETTCRCASDPAAIAAPLSAVEAAFADLRAALTRLQDTLPQEHPHVS
ncbi:hypothetical protein MARPU_08930 [Marichromatium purpuratum 984]|uniref:Sensory/regulatory protein RpfC n=1 Tax=Marichromatium purpuratum 984 TaxID=765910 RepID=W0E413_MARPU|nr:response regulator [Marichromatium purpuratum]AHF05492.1 hypothetical protein MARPU_08930 [Marichromatium purpuratum 984]